MRICCATVRHMSAAIGEIAEWRLSSYVCKAKGLTREVMPWREQKTAEPQLLRSRMLVATGCGGPALRCETTVRPLKGSGRD